MNLLRLASLCSALAWLPCIPAPADVVTEWNTLLLQAIRNESTSPPLTARNLAILHVAIFDAVNAITQAHEPYLVSLPAPPGTWAEAATVGAAYECLLDLYPSQSAAFESAYGRFLTDTPNTTGREDGLKLGEATALFVLSWRSADGSSTTVPYIPRTAPGEWRRTGPFFRPPELPHWPYVTPFAMTNGAQFRPPGPPALTSTQYARDFNLVKDLGALNSVHRTPEQTLIARFWSDFSYTVTPPGHWNEIAQNVAASRNQTLSENARLFALLNLAMADAGILAWDAKYAYNFWRPLTAIQAGDLDDNAETEVDPSWTPLLNTPPFPEYISGHSTFSAAAATILEAFCGTDQVPFLVKSDTLPGVVRTYSSFSAAAEEIGWSRIYGGIHFLSADLDGLEAGHRVGNYVWQKLLRAIPDTPTLEIARIGTDGRLRLTLNGTEHQTYILETSNALRDWTPLTTNTAPFTVEQDAVSRSPLRFFRARSLE